MESQAPVRRGIVLHALLGQYPLALTQVALERQVAPFYKAADGRALSRDLAYLEEKQFLRHESHEVGGRVFNTFILTPAGVDIVERVAVDAGVEIAQAS